MSSAKKASPKPKREKPKKTSASSPVTSYFSLGDLVLIGKFKSAQGKIIGFGEDKWGNPTVEVEPIPKGRKQNKIIGLFKIWRADVKHAAGKN